MIGELQLRKLHRELQTDANTTHGGNKLTISFKLFSKLVINEVDHERVTKTDSSGAARIL